MWQQWTTALLGLLVAAVPFLGLNADALTWTLAILGLGVTALAVWGGAREQDLGNRFQHQ